MTPLATRLQINDGMRGRILSKPRDLELPLSHSSTGSNFSIGFVKRRRDVAPALAKATEVLEPDGLLWFCYPKQSSKIDSEINRDHGWAPLHEAAYRGVRQIALNDDWSALRFCERDRAKTSQ